MGETLFIQAHSHGREQSVPSSELLASIQPYASPTECQQPGWYDLTFSETETCSISLDADANGRISHFAVHRPCLDRRHYEILFNFMRQANWVLFSGSGGLFIAANPTAINHLPDGMADGMAESLGTPKITRDPDSFFRACTNADTNT